MYNVVGICISKVIFFNFILINSYSIVAFGGAPPFDSPRSIVYKNEVFTDYRNIRNYFKHIKTSASNHSDIFEAIHMASNLIYRPGATKTFILLPCSQCNSTLMKVLIRIIRISNKQHTIVTY